MSGRTLHGLGAARGVAVGRALVVREPEPGTNGSGGAAEQARAIEALEEVERELGRRAEELRSLGHADEAEILEANRLMAIDPSLVEEVRSRAAETSAAAAVRTATEGHASRLAALADPLLAARAADVRELGRRAARLLAGGEPFLEPSEPSVLIARDLGPAEVVEVQTARKWVRGIALADGAVTSHAAIMARALGLPMAVALGEQLLEAVDGEDVVLDGDEGTLVLSPSTGEREAAAARERRAERRRQELAAARGLPAVTRDGRAIGLLCNVSTAAEVAAGLEAGAQGVGLLRTELAFLDAPSWPSEEQYGAALAPALAQLEGRVATVRTLDFGADKTPPFLRGVETRGVLLMLAHPDELATQLRAILRAGARTRLRVLFPMVERVEQIRAARTLLAQAAADVGWSGERPQLGAMIETPAAAAAAPDLALEADFFSIGTNDLVQYTLGLDRELPVATALAAADPEVLALVARTAAAGERAGIAVDVCGEAASEPALAALFIGLGVTELSVAPARVDEIRAVVRGLAAVEAGEIVQAALDAPTAERALALAAALLSGEVGDERDEALDGLGGAVA